MKDPTNTRMMMMTCKADVQNSLSLCSWSTSRPAQVGIGAVWYPEPGVMGRPGTRTIL